MPNKTLSKIQTCRGCSSCIICLSDTRSHWLGAAKPVSDSLIPIEWCRSTLWFQVFKFFKTEQPGHAVKTLNRNKPTTKKKQIDQVVTHKQNMKNRISNTFWKLARIQCYGRNKQLNQETQKTCKFVDIELSDCYQIKVFIRNV